MVQDGMLFVCLHVATVVPWHTSVLLNAAAVQAFTTGPQFRGTKMVPPGPHALTTTLVSIDKITPTVSHWVMVRSGAIEVATWDADRGRFVSLPDADEVWPTWPTGPFWECLSCAWQDMYTLQAGRS